MILDWLDSVDGAGSAFVTASFFAAGLSSQHMYYLSRSIKTALDALAYPTVNSTSNTNLLIIPTPEFDSQTPIHIFHHPIHLGHNPLLLDQLANPTASGIQHAILHLLPPNPTPLNHHSRPPSPHRYCSLPHAPLVSGSLLTTLDTETLALRTDADAMVANSWIAGVDGNAAATET